MTGTQQKEPRDLRVGIAITRDYFDLVESLTERELADALRIEAERLEYPHLLLAVADALDHPDAPISLKLVRSKRGAPKAKSTLELDVWVADHVADCVARGMKQEAAIAEVMQRLSVSRATAMKALARGREMRRFIDSLAPLAAEVRKKSESK